MYKTVKIMYLSIMKQILILIIVSLTSIMAAAQNRFDVVITELMADPTPVVTLPAVEYLEIKNTTTANINLLGWKVANANSVSGAIPSYILKPDSFLIVCSSGSVAALSAYGPTISVTSFPSLANDGDIMSIRASNGRTIHAVAYTIDWYQNAVKKDGGWSLEMIDTKNPCIGIDNWKASIDPRGGTPGTKNSVDAINTDTKAPQLARSYTNSASQIVAVFNEPVDSAIAAVASNYTFSNGITVISAVPQAPMFQEVFLNLSGPLVSGTTYNLTVTNVPDCKGNSIGAFNKARSGLPVDADSLDIIVNEILFNPKPNGFDYVEVYNKSGKIVDANKLFIANKNTAGVIANVKKMSETPCLIFPGDFITLTESANWVKNNYNVANADWLINVPTMPSFNDDAGNVILLNFQGKVIDALSYKDDWHFKLLDNVEGISLERIDYTVATQNADSWHSASFSSGFGTPTAKNSQFNSGGIGSGNITVLPKTFSPDNDGTDDVLKILYNFTQRGFIANVSIYDANGIVVKNLRRNDLLGFNGSFTWDGLSEKGQKLPTGIYIVWVEVFNTTGKKQQFKNTVVLARKLQ
jgi:hypothetical protein